MFKEVVTFSLNRLGKPLVVSGGGLGPFRYMFRFSLSHSLTMTSQTCSSVRARRTVWLMLLPLWCFCASENHWGMLGLFVFQTVVCQVSLSNFTGACDFFLIFLESVKAQTLASVFRIEMNFIKIVFVYKYLFFLNYAFTISYLIFMSVLMRFPTMSSTMFSRGLTEPPELIYNPSLTTNGFSVYSLHIPASLQLCIYGCDALPHYNFPNVSLKEAQTMGISHI